MSSVVATESEANTAEANTPEATRAEATARIPVMVPWLGEEEAGDHRAKPTVVH